jgi:hypothetical protein
VTMGDGGEDLRALRNEFRLAHIQGAGQPGRQSLREAADDELGDEFEHRAVRDAVGLARLVGRGVTWPDFYDY